VRIYQTWLKKHLVSFLSPEKGHILISQRVLQTQISTGTELGDHSRNLACPESSHLDLGILRVSLWIVGCQSLRHQGAVGLPGQAGSWADATAELSCQDSGKPRCLKLPCARHKSPSHMSLDSIASEHPFQTGYALNAKGWLLPMPMGVSWKKNQI